MKFRCERDVLVDVLNAAGRAVSSRASLPVLNGLRLELAGDQITVTGSDLDLTITATTTVSGEEDGTSVIPAKLAAEIARSLESGKVTVEIDGDAATISSGRSQFSLRTLPAAEYPRIVEPTGEGITLDAKALGEGLRQVVTAASTDDSRPILTGVLMASEPEGLRLVATDSYRLAVRDLRGTSFLAEGESVLVPSSALRELQRLISTETVTMVLGDKDVLFVLGDVRVLTRLIEGEFPNYRSLIPSAQPNKLTVGREALLETVKRVAVVANDQSTPVRLTMRPDGLEISATAQDVGAADEELEAKYEGTELTVAFNPEYLVKGIEASTGDEVTLETLDALKPALLRSLDSSDFLYLLMPVRVS